MSTKNVGYRIKCLMREEKWGAKAFANRINADKNSVKAWLACEYYPGYNSLVKLCELFGVSADYIVGLSNERGKGLRLGVPPLDEIKNQYVKRVVGLLGENQISEEKYADMMGVKKATVQKWLSGKKFPQMTHVVRSAAVLGCTLDYLLSRDGNIQ